MRYFVFAELGNKEVLDFLASLRQALSGDVNTSPIHITLRGPYAKPPSIDRLNELAAILPGYGVRIVSHGLFSTPRGFAVFLRAECSVFRQLWDKPDYKVPLGRIEPHITVFESQVREAAIEVQEFLKTEDIEIYTRSVFLSVYRSPSRQNDLFGLPVAVPDGKPLTPDSLRFRAGVLDRARVLGDRVASMVAAA